LIETGQELDDQYCAAFSNTGGDPEACVGVIWMHSVNAGNPTITTDEMLAEIVRKINDGTADHGWLISLLTHLWNDFSQGSRLRIMNSLAEGGAYKWLVTRDLTTAEKNFLRPILQERRAVAALRRLDNAVQPGRRNG
jgi:hypothetical protein